MAVRYTDEEKAKVLNILDINDGNVKRTARDTGVAEQTIRDWKKTWEAGGVPATVQAALPAAQGEFADDAERVRNLMLNNLEAAVLNNTLSGRDLIVGIGVLTDKLRLSRGEATSRSETVSTPPTADAIGEAVNKYLAATFAAGEERDVEIEDADWTEQAPQGELEPPVSPS